jgi:glycosyltransferase
MIRMVIGMKYVPVIPCYNPPEVFSNIILELYSMGVKDVIIIDDGSNNKRIFSIANKKGYTVIEHNTNKGKGEAIKSGIRYYRKHFIDKYKGIVMIDCDGQHRVWDMDKVGQEMIHSDKFTMGVRNFNIDGVPFRNKIGNKITSLVFKWMFGVYIKDTQTGLRGVPNRLIDTVLKIDGERYEYEISMLIDIVKMKEEIKEVEIETVYDNNEKRYSYFNPFKDSYRIYKEMIKKSKK